MAAVAQPAPKAQAAKPSSTGLPWVYDTSVDKMEGKSATYATLRSTNSLNFSFPYAGSNYGSLMVRQHPKYGLDVILQIDKGQVLCRSDDCPVSIKFDDAKPMRFTGTGPADHSTTTIFIQNESKFIAAARKAKKVLVQFNAYHQGSPILEFEAAEPLVWPPKK